MASDLSNILNNEFENTLEQLLSKKIKIDSIQKIRSTSIAEKLIECNVQVNVKGFSSSLYFYIPTSTATKFEFLMLGETGAKKEIINEETVDAIHEIISNICGSFSTSVNAQGLADLGSIRTDIQDTKIVESSSLLSKEDAYEFKFTIEEEIFYVVIVFDKLLLSFFSEITGVYQKEVKEEHQLQSTNSNSLANGHHFILPSKNLELLYNVKLKLSVRLGTKIVLLKDILRWDLGEIIELEQMVNEPLEILINGVKIGEGEAVIVEGKFGLKIKKILNEEIQIEKLGL